MSARKPATDKHFFQHELPKIEMSLGDRLKPGIKKVTSNYAKALVEGNSEVADKFRAQLVVMLTGADSQPHHITQEKFNDALQCMLCELSSIAKQGSSHEGDWKIAAKERYEYVCQSIRALTTQFHKDLGGLVETQFYNTFKTLYASGSVEGFQCQCHLTMGIMKDDSHNRDGWIVIGKEDEQHRYLRQLVTALVEAGPSSRMSDEQKLLALEQQKLLALELRNVIYFGMSLDVKGSDYPKFQNRYGFAGQSAPTNETSILYMQEGLLNIVMAIEENLSQKGEKSLFNPGTEQGYQRNFALYQESVGRVRGQIEQKISEDRRSNPAAGPDPKSRVMSEVPSARPAAGKAGASKRVGGVVGAGRPPSGDNPPISFIL